MPFVTLGIQNHDNLIGVSAADHHAATVAGDLNLADLAENLHASLSSVGAGDHGADASQAQIEAETVVSQKVTPHRVRFSPGVAKLRAHITISGALSAGSYNVASVTDTGVGNRTVVIDDDFSAATFQPGSQLLEENITGGQSQSYVDTLAVGSFRHRIYDESVNLQDQVTCVWAFGDQ